jgi:hypothetical protein
MKAVLWALLDLYLIRSNNFFLFGVRIVVRDEVVQRKASARGTLAHAFYEGCNMAGAEPKQEFSL